MSDMPTDQPTTGTGDIDTLVREVAELTDADLPAELRPAKLEDTSAQSRNYIGADWVTADGETRVVQARGRAPLVVAFGVDAYEQVYASVRR